MIAYDTNVLIYALEGTSEFAGAAQAVVAQGETEGAVLSTLAWQELVTGAVLRGGVGAEKKLAAVLADLKVTKFEPVTMAVCARAVELTKRYGRRLYGYDAIHVAAAIESGARVFVTNDKALLGLGLSEIEAKGL